MQIIINKIAKYFDFVVQRLQFCDYLPNSIIISSKNLHISKKMCTFAVAIEIAMEKNRTIIHLEWKNAKEPQHEYFGSPASLYDKFTNDDLGIGQGALNNLFNKQAHAGITQVYANNTCIIRKGKLYCKDTERGRKAANRLINKEL